MHRGDDNTYPWVKDVLTVIAGFAVAALIGGGILIIGTSTVVLPHSFYETACCSGNDCTPIASYRVDQVGGGYLIDGLHFVPESQARNSPDGMYHACFPSKDKLRCLYRPPMSM